MIVALYYGSLIWGMLPEELFSKLAEPSRISWQSHLAGGIVGVILAFIFRKQGEKRKNSSGNFLIITAKKMIDCGKNIKKITLMTS